MTHHRSAFTLIELLVVVAIVALLLAILMPGLQAAREQSRQARCGAGLRSFATGFHAYAAENQGWSCSGSFDPEVSNGRDGPVDKVGWVADLVNGRLAFPGEQLCPSNPARYNQKLGAGAAGANSYTPAQAQDLIERGYNTNYTQAWYMGRTQWRGDPQRRNMRRLGDTLGPLQFGRWVLVGESRIPLIGDARTDTDNLVLNERAVKTMTDGPFGGPCGTQNYADFGPAHGAGSWISLGRVDHDRVRANILLGDGSVRVFMDRDRDGQFGLDDSVQPAEQRDLSEAVIFDGILSLGRRSAREDGFE